MTKEDKLFELMDRWERQFDKPLQLGFGGVRVDHIPLIESCLNLNDPEPLWRKLAAELASYPEGAVL